MSDRRLALITGGTSGIGLGAAKQLLPNHDLALAYGSDDAKADRARHELKELLPNAVVRTYKLRLHGETEAQQLTKMVEKDFGALPDVLVNSAGRIDDGLFLDMAFSRHVAIVQEHLITTMALSHLLLKSMYKKKFGRIVNLSSISAQYAKRGQSNYAAAKAGIEGFTRTLALEVAHRGVTINAVAPGLIDTPMTESIIAKMQSDPKEMRKRVPAGYAGTPFDVGSLIAFLCSEGARYITGQVITIDGGRSLGDPES